MAAFPLTLNPLCNTEMEYHDKFEHTVIRIQHISIMSIIDIFYTVFHQGT